MNRRYPLDWPAGWKRTPPDERRPSKFHSYNQPVTINGGFGRVMEQVQHFGPLSIVMISTNWPVRANAEAYYARPGYLDDTGAAVYFTIDGTPHCLACDRYLTVPDNLAAIAKHMDALRGMLRWGVGEKRQAFAGYAALPPGYEEWWLVLGIPRTSAIEEVQDAFRRLAIDAHPDHGGREHDMARLNAARDAALVDIRGSLNAAS